jgi:hypothetical protein
MKQEENFFGLTELTYSDHEVNSSSESGNTTSNPFESGNTTPKPFGNIVEVDI